MSAPQPFTIAYQPGRTVVVKVTNAATNSFWNGTLLSFETYNPANETQYRIALSDPNNIGWYTAILPSQFAGMTVQVIAYDTYDMTRPIGASEMAPPDTTGGSVTPTSPAVVSIVNKALMLLGVPLIASLDEDSEAANRASQIFDSVRDDTLREHFWKFATYAAPLALLADETYPGFQYLYAYPAQCLMIRRVFDDTSVDPSIFAVGFLGFTFDWDFVQHYDLYKDTLYKFREVISPTTFTKSIASNLENAYIEFTYRVTDPTLWDNTFIEAFAMKLAAALGNTLTANTALTSAAQDAYNKKISEAKRLDAQEDRPSRHTMSTFQRARM